MWSFLLCCSILSSIYISEFVVVWFPPPIISQFYISLLPTRYDGMQCQFQNYPNNPIVTGWYCCVLLFPIILAFHSCHIFSTHCHFNTPPGLVRTNSSPMSCILLYYYISHHGWLLYIISIVGQGRYTYMHQHFTLYITRFEHSATRVRWPRTPSFCHGITKSQQ